MTKISKLEHNILKTFKHQHISVPISSPFDKKIELMLTRRAKAYSSSSSVV